MQKRYFNHLFLLTLILSSFSSGAITETNINGPEKKLTGNGGILDKLYGWENLTRIDDYDSVITDQYWSLKPGSAMAYDTIVAKYSSFSLDPGFIIDQSDSILFNTDLSNITPGQTVRLGIEIDSKPGFVWSSAVSDNKIMPNGYVFSDTSVIDHMVTYQISSSSKKHSDNIVGNYIVAWEDLSPEKLWYKFDGDYNDIIVEISGLEPVSCPTPVPEPPTIALLAICSIALIKRYPHIAKASQQK